MKRAILPALLAVSGLFVPAAASAEWEPIERLSRAVTGPFGVLSDPEIASGGGVTTVVWRREVAGAGVAVAVVQRSDGRWGQAAGLFEPSSRLDVDVAMDDAGNTIVVTCDDNTGQVLARELPRRWTMERDNCCAPAHQRMLRHRGRDGRSGQSRRDR